MLRNKSWKVALAALCAGVFAIGSVASTAQAADLYVYGGGGGGGGASDGVTLTAEGGAGGAANSDETLPAGAEAGATGDTETSAGGAGGAGGGGGSASTSGSGTIDGGNGDDKNVTASDGTYDTVAVVAGNGGAGGSAEDVATALAGDGGDGGDAILNVGDITIDTALTVTAGDGAAGGTEAGGQAGTAGAGGAGGNATFNATGTVTLNAAATVTAGVASTAGNDGADGAGGKVTFNAATLAAGASNGTITFTAGAGSSAAIAIGAAEAVDGNLTMDFSGVDNTDAGVTATLGKITIGDGTAGRTFAITGTQGTNFDWNGKMSVVGAGNTLTGALDTTGISGSSLEFDLTGVTAGDTMLTGSVTTDAATTIAISNGSSALLGGNITLVSAFGGTYADTATSSVTDSVGNTATMTTSVYNAGGMLMLTGTGLEAANDWVESTTLSLTADGMNDFVYKVGRELTLETGVNLTFDGTAGNIAVDIGTLNAEGASTVTFTSTAVNVTGGTGDADNYAKIGNIVLQDGSNLTVAGTQYDGTNAATANFVWSGNLTTNNNVTLGGVDLSGKNITMNVDSSTYTSGSTLLTGGTGGLTVDADTKISIVDIKKDMRESIEDGTTTIQVLDNGGTITGVTTLDDAEVALTSGTYKGSGILASGLLTGAAFSLDDGAAHNALLGGSALVTLLKGGADVVEKATGSFTPMYSRGFGQDTGTQVGGFASFSGGRVTANTNSHIKSNNFHLLVGPGMRISNGTGKTDFGAFFEAGWGSYDTYNSFNRGDGNSSYYGGGIMLRHESCIGLYGEMSARGGYSKSEYSSRRRNDYDLEAAYYGGHLGIGYIANLSETSSLDVFAKGLWTRLEGDEQTNRAGERMRVDSSDSLRTQIGAKYSYNIGCNATVFAKAAWEHEYDGESTGRLDGARIRKADMGGSSGLGELGVDWKVGERASIGASAYGIVGTRRGFGGNLNVSFGF